MATIGVIKIAAEFSAAGIKKGAAESIAALNKFSSSAASVGNAIIGSISPMTAALAAAAGPAALGALTKSGMDSINTTRNMAAQLGETTESLSRLEYAANVAGIESGMLDGSLSKLNVKLADVVATGSGPAAESLKKLGLNAADLAKGGPIAAFSAIADGINGVKNGAEKAQIAVSLFEEEGLGLLRLTEGGSAGIASMGAEADALRVTLSGIDAEKVGLAQESMNKLWAATSVLGKTLASELAPYIAYAADLMVDFGKQGLQSGGYLSEAFEWIKAGAGFAVDAFEALKIGGKGAFLALQYGLHSLVGLLGKLVSGIEWVLDKTTGLKSNVGASISDYAADVQAGVMGDVKKLMEDMGGPSLRERLGKQIAGIQADADKRAKLRLDAAPNLGAAISSQPHTKDKEEKKAAGKSTEAKGSEPKLSGAVSLGSAEAMKAVSKFRMGASPNDTIQRQVAVNTKETANEVRNMARAFDRAAKNQIPVINSLVGN